MSTLRLFCSHSETNVESCFESILARSWYMAHEPLAYAHLDEMQWLSLILSDNHRVRTALLHAEYCHSRSKVMQDQSALKALQRQYYRLQCVVTPICRLPVEVLGEVFHHALDIGESRTGLMHVCQDWRKTIEGMSNIWSSFKVQAWTAPESVQQSLSRAGGRPLVVEIDIENSGNTVGTPYSALGIAATSASQWTALTITSLYQSEREVQYVDDLLSMRLQPMTQLRHLSIMQSVSSPLPHPLLQNIATDVVGSLTTMEINSPLALVNISHPAYTSIFGSLTTFKAKVPKLSHAVNLLPHFRQLRVLHLINVPLPISDNSSPLPLANTLHHLHLRGVSIQWMGGQVFPQLESCTIIAPLSSLSLQRNVHLPACTNLHFENWNVSSRGQFSAPQLGYMTVRDNVWNPARGNEQIVQLCGAGFGIVFQPRYLHLTVACKDRMLLVVLRLLPELEELRLDLPRPSALGKHFFTALVAKPVGQVDWERFDGFKEGKVWRAMVCPHLRVLELTYQQWLRQTDSLDFLAPMFAMNWSRERTTTPLKLDIHFQSSQNFWKSFALSPQSTLVISRLEIPSLLHPDNALPFDLLEHCFISVTHLPLVISTWKRGIYETPLFALCCYHLQVLKIDGHGEILKIPTLQSFQQLRALSLNNIFIPPLSHTVYLPLVHTLRNLSLFMSTISWMGGRVFARLKRFEVDEDSWPQFFRQQVALPACTHVIFSQHKLRVLPLLQSSFLLPILNMWEFVYPWEDSGLDQRGISALQIIQTKGFYFQIWGDCQRLLDLLESKDEVEQVEFQIGPAFHLQRTLNRLSVVNGNTMKMSCSNMKVLGLHCSEISSSMKYLVREWCVQMMNSRRSAGHPMEKCCIWWDQAREGAPQLVLAAE